MVGKVVVGRVRGQVGEVVELELEMREEVEEEEEGVATRGRMRHLGSEMVESGLATLL